MTLTTKQEAQIARIFEAVQQVTGASRSEMIGPSRQAGVCQARWLAMFCISENLNLSRSRVGRIFGGRDHSTVTHAVKELHNRLALDGELADKFDSLMGSLDTAPAPTTEPTDNQTEAVRLLLDAQQLLNRACALLGA